MFEAKPCAVCKGKLAFVWRDEDENGVEIDGGGPDVLVCFDGYVLEISVVGAHGSRGYELPSPPVIVRHERGSRSQVVGLTFLSPKTMTAEGWRVSGHAASVGERLDRVVRAWIELPRDHRLPS